MGGAQRNFESLNEVTWMRRCLSVLSKREVPVSGPLQTISVLPKF
jgi:hypothetical protein